MEGVILSTYTYSKYPNEIYLPSRNADYRFMSLTTMRSEAEPVSIIGNSNTNFSIISLRSRNILCIDMYGMVTWYPESWGWNNYIVHDKWIVETYRGNLLSIKSSRDNKFLTAKSLAGGGYSLTLETTPYYWLVSTSITDMKDVEIVINNRIDAIKKELEDIEKNTIEKNDELQKLFNLNDVELPLLQIGALKEKLNTTKQNNLIKMKEETEAYILDYKNKKIAQYMKQVKGILTIPFTIDYSNKFNGLKKSFYLNRVREINKEYQVKQSELDAEYQKTYKDYVNGLKNKQTEIITLENKYTEEVKKTTADFKAEQQRLSANYLELELKNRESLEERERVLTEVSNKITQLNISHEKEIDLLRKEYNDDKEEIELEKKKISDKLIVDKKTFENELIQLEQKLVEQKTELIKDKDLMMKQLNNLNNEYEKEKAIIRENIAIERKRLEELLVKQKKLYDETLIQNDNEHKRIEESKKEMAKAIAEENLLQMEVIKNKYYEETEKVLLDVELKKKELNDLTNIRNDEEIKKLEQQITDLRRAHVERVNNLDILMEVQKNKLLETLESNLQFIINEKKQYETEYEKKKSEYDKLNENLKNREKKLKDELELLEDDYQKEIQKTLGEQDALLINHKNIISKLERERELLLSESAKTITNLETDIININGKITALQNNLETEKKLLKSKFEESLSNIKLQKEERLKEFIESRQKLITIQKDNVKKEQSESLNRKDKAVLEFELMMNKLKEDINSLKSNIEVNNSKNTIYMTRIFIITMSFIGISLFLIK